MIKEGIEKLVESRNLTYEECTEIMKELMTGNATQAQMGAFLTALRMKRETVEEVSAMATVMRDFCYKIHPKVNGRLVDTCGTGGDRIKTFNISTTAAFVIAGAGVSVAKHGNRSVTSRSGSADVLEKLGLNLNQEPKSVERGIEEIGIGFMFAPTYHPAMKHVIGARREIGIRTIFNILGPLTNPANANAQVLGVYDKACVQPLSLVLKNLGCEEAMVVNGLDGLDEISTVGENAIAWLREGEISTLKMAPRDLGVGLARPEDIIVTTPEQSVELTFRLLRGDLRKGDPKRDILLVNAAAGIIVGGKADNFSYGIEVAEESIQSGAAYGKLKATIKASGGDMAELEELERRYA